MPTKNTKVTHKDIPHTCILPNHNPAAVTNDNTTMACMALCSKNKLSIHSMLQRYHFLAI